MNEQLNSTSAPQCPDGGNGLQMHLRGKSLVLARGVWLLLTAPMLLCLLPSFLAYYQVLHRVKEVP